ncbi:MAG: bifunctional precorrin-2 dehydrogenase/sirohydrochlorin ferrochelatase [Candidatus Omnitrophica bacterium]|nr:bifunctional precorrin-2 dehydrogenase/sirohydrochlorin ferrochelatase [Candidatus Omnitrophota bacterium]
MYNYMPVCFYIRGQSCLVVGGGNVAYRKISLVRRFGARVTCLSPEFIRPLQLLARRKEIKCIKERYPQRMFLKKYALVIAATDDPRVNSRVCRDASRDKTLVNVVDKSIAGTVIMPAILKRKGFLVSVSTGGSCPRRAKKVRDIINDAL